jgi:hypothetical protein
MVSEVRIQYFLPREEWIFRSCGFCFQSFCVYGYLEMFSALQNKCQYFLEVTYAAFRPIQIYLNV